MKKPLYSFAFILSVFLIIYSCSAEEDTTPPPTVQQPAPEPEPPAPTQYTLEVTAGEGGTVSSEGGTYDEGTEVTITATPNEGYVFVGWEGINSQENEVTLSITSNRSFTAIFVEIHFSIEEYEILIDPIVAEGSYIENIAMMFNQNNIPSTFIYSHNKNYYLLVTGQVCGAGECDNVQNKDNVPAMSSILFKYDESLGWKFIKSFPEAKTWNIRAFGKKGNYIAMGDGNEIGPGNWKGNGYIGEIIEDDILWKKFNDDQSMSYQHDISIGDINGDDLIDVIPFPMYKNHAVFLNNSSSFTPKDGLEYFDAHNMSELVECDSDEDCLFHRGMGLSGQIDDLDNDGVDEIIFSGDDTFIFKKEGDKYKFQSILHVKQLYPEYNRGDPLGSTMIEIEDLNNDGIKDILISREFIIQNGGQDTSRDYHSFDLWIGQGDLNFKAHSIVKVDDDLICREFKLMDVNNDGFLDVILKANFGYYTYDGFNTDRGYDWDIYFREPEPKGVILNELIYVNDGNGKFSKYQEKNLYIDRIKPYQIFPYMRNGRLHFIGFSFKSDPNLSPNNIPFKEGKVPIIFYDIELDL